MRAGTKRSMKPLRDRARQQQWRAKIPEAQRRLDFVLGALDEGDHRRKRDVPKEWRTLVSRMRERVQTKVKADLENDISREMKVAAQWSLALFDVSDMVEHLTTSIQAELGLKEGTSLASVILLEQSIWRLREELRDFGTKGGSENGLENRFRVQEALRPLSTRFDDLQMQRLRALQVAEGEGKFVHIPGPDEVEERLDSRARELPFKPGDDERHRKEIEIGWPMAVAVMVHRSLAEVDERFAEIDPLVVLEEFAEARNLADDGRPKDAGGRTGPVLALARLAVMCEALGFARRNDEDFDTAAERARNNLLVARSRIKKSVCAFLDDVATFETSDSTGVKNDPPESAKARGREVP